VKAHEYNTTDGKGFKLFAETILSDPQNPKVACHPNGLHCLMLVYENNSFFGKGVKIWFANDFFRNFFTRWQIGSVSIDFSAYEHGYYDNFNLPYDVAYIEDEGKYYFFVFNTVYSYDGTTLSTIGTFSGVNPNNRIGLSYTNENENIVITFEPSSDFAITAFKGTQLLNSYSIRATWAGATNLFQGTNWYNGSIRVTGSSVPGCTATTSCTVNISLGSFPTTFTGLDYWLNGEVVYQRDDNSSWSVTTDDMSSFGTPTLIYGWDSSIRENITHSDSDITSGNQIYVYKRESNDTNEGVWVYNLPLTEISFLMEGFNPNKGFTELVNITATVNCSKETFTDSDSGDLATIQTPCTEDNILSISSFTFRPNSFIFNNFTIPSNCIGLSNLIRTSTTSGYISPYDVTVNYFDELFGTRIEGVSATLNGDPETSDSNGEAIFSDVFPVNNDNFTVETIESACTTRLTFTGNSKAFSLISTKSGYESKTDNFFLAESPFNIEEGNFIKTKNIIMTPINTIVNVKVFTSDAVEISPSSLSITLEGSNSTFWSLNNQLFNTNVATQSPARFVLLNNTGTFEINVTVDYFGEFIEKRNVSVSSTTDIDVFINYTSSALPCFIDTDCQSDLCVGSIYKKFLSCQSNLCTYRPSDCITSDKCDTILGCVDLVSTTNCTRDSDCVNTCSTDFVMINNKCGDNNFCKGVFVDCDTSCNSTLGYCQELADCVTGNSKEFTAGFWIDPFGTGQQVFVGKTETAKCDFDNVNTNFCIFPDSLVITKTQLDANQKTTDDIVFDPQPWTIKFINDGNDIQFLPASVRCDSFCNISWVFCEKGCDLNTGLCMGLDKATDDSLGLGSTPLNIIEGFWAYYDIMFPDIHSQSLVWFLMGIGFLLFINIFAFIALPRFGNIKVSLGVERDIIILLAWIFIGSVSGRFYSFVWIVLTVIAIFVLVTYFNNRQDKA